MDTLICILSCLTIGAQQALGDGRDWRPYFEMPNLYRKVHPQASLILAQLHDDRVDLALVRAMPANEQQAPLLPSHAWYVVPVAELAAYKKQLEAHLLSLRAEFEGALDASSAAFGPFDGEEEEEEDEDEERAALKTDEPI